MSNVREKLAVEAMRAATLFMAILLPLLVAYEAWALTWWSIAFMPPVLVCSWALLVLRDNLP